MPVHYVQHRAEHGCPVRVKPGTDLLDELLGRALRVLGPPLPHGSAGPFKVFGLVLAEPHRGLLGAALNLVVRTMADASLNIAYQRGEASPQGTHCCAIVTRRSTSGSTL